MVRLDAHGEAEIQLGKWCDALNHRFRYQLTPIGSPAPDLHIAQKFSANSFKIEGGQASMQVCWQLTDVRQNAFAQAHPLVVEEPKPARERGHYLHPELYGQPTGKSVEWARGPDLMCQLDQLADQTEACTGTPP